MCAAEYPSRYPLAGLLRRHVAGCLLAGSALTAGCTIPPRPPESIATLSAVPVPPRPNAVPAVPPVSEIPVVRYGRYTLVELTPEPDQRDLMQQVVDVTLPPTLKATVGAAMRHVLLDTGYQLCDRPDVSSLYHLPLPAAHRHLGPLVLRDALQILAGPAWDLVVDDFARHVCFVRHTPVAATPVPDSGPAAAGSHQAVQATVPTTQPVPSAAQAVAVPLQEAP